MGIISTIKEMLGIDEPRRSPGSGTTVTVERERTGSRQETSRASEASPPAGPSVSEPEPSVPEAEPETSAVGEEEEAAEEAPAPSTPSAAATGEPVETITGIGPAYAERLGDAGIETVDQLAAADAADLAGETDIPESRVQEWIDLAQGSD